MKQNIFGFLFFALGAACLGVGLYMGYNKEPNPKNVADLFAYGAGIGLLVASYKMVIK